MRLLQRVRSGAPASAFVEGEPGIGKTRLFDETLKRASGFSVFSAHCEELLRDRPFGPLAEALRIDYRSKDPVRSEVAALLLAADDRGPAGPGPELRFRILDALLTLLERSAGEGPVLLGVEDIHWADDSTLLALERIIRGVVGLPFLILATLRPVPRASSLERVLARSSRSVAHIDLGPLQQEAVVALVTEVAGAAPGPRLLDAVDAAGGNPLFVRELVGALHEEGAVSTADGRAEVDRVVLPPSLRLTIVSQLTALPTQTVALLRTASVLGATLRPTHLAALFERKVSELVSELEPAVRGGVLAEGRGGLAFRHELVREAVYLDLPEAVRRALHLESARALARAGAPADEVAYHFSLGAERGDADAASWIIEAARHAAPLSPVTATGLYRRALDLAPDLDDKVQVLAELAETLLWSGQLEEATQTAEEALAATSDAELSRQLRRSLARTCLMQGRAGDALGHLQAAPKADEADEGQRWRLEAEYSLAAMFCGDLPGSIEKAEGLRAAAERLDDDWLRCEAHVVLGLGAFFSGRVADSVELLGRALGPAARRPDAYRYGPHIFLGTALIDADRLEDANRLLMDGLRLSERMGLWWHYAFYHAQIGLQRFVCGRWDDAAGEFEIALTDMWRSPGLSVFTLAHLGTMAIHRGDMDAGESHIAAAAEAASSGSSFGVDTMMWAQSLLFASTSDLPKARTVLENAWQLNVMLGFTSQCVRLGPDLARLAIATQDPGLAQSVAAVMEDAAALNPVGSWSGAALLCRGLAQDDPEILAQALAAYRSSPRPIERALACLDAASVFARRGAGGATEIVNEALDVIEPLGLKPHIARADSLLRSLGVSRGRRGRRSRPATGWDSLTETELAVARLAAEGLTNPEIGRRLYISRRTVESHLSRAFAKLGLSSRVQLAAEVARRSG
jgi:DNA-binding CsgD family transcriptional regulator